MFEKRNNEKVIPIEDMPSIYKGLFYLSEVEPSDNGINMGRVLAVATFEDIDKLKRFEAENQASGRDVEIGVSNMSNATVTMKQLEYK